MTAPVFIAVAGGSGSGKSTLCAALLERLPPGAAVLLSEDWYYRDISAAPEFDPARFDFDDISVRDHDLLIAHLAALRRGAAINAPRYSFERHAREAGTTPVAAAAVVVVEGCHLLCRGDLAAAFDLKVYLDTPDDIRLIRRIIRDQNERGRSLPSILEQYLRTVRPAQARLTGPSRAAADMVLADDSGAVTDPGERDLRALLEPILSHPVLVGRLGRVRDGGDPERV